MGMSRREFVWAMGTAAGALAALPAQGVHWAPTPQEDAGWAPGLERRPRSACLQCPAHCGIEARVVDDRLVGIVGNRLHPMNRGGVCPRGIAALQSLYHPNRIAAPLLRLGDRGAGRWRQISREEALEMIGDRLMALREGGRPEALATFAGHCAGSMKAVWRQFMDAFGSPNLVFAEDDDATATVMALMHGIDQRPGYDLERADTVVSFGAPLFESWWSPLHAYVAFGTTRAEGSRRRFIHVDQRFSRTAAYADEWVGIKPGTHGILALGMAYVILRDRLFDAGFVTRHVAGFEDFLDARGTPRDGFRTTVLRRYRTEEVSAITGVTVERITELARAFANGGRSVAVCGADVTLAPNGLLAGLAVHSLNVLVGNVNQPGGVVFAGDAPVSPLAPIVRDAVGLTGLSTTPIGRESPGESRRTRPEPRFADMDLPHAFVESVAAGPDSRVEALFVHNVDPLAWQGRREPWKEALDRIPFVVSFSPFLDDTTRYADVVLPELLPPERWQDAPTPPSYPFPVWAMVQPMVEPHPGGMHTGDAVLALARQIGGSVAASLPYADFERLLRARARGLFEARRGRVLGTSFELEIQRQREERGWWLPRHADFESFWADLVEHGGWADVFHDRDDPENLARTGSGRIELMPPGVQESLTAFGKQLHVLTPPPEATEDATYPLRLLPYRVSTISSESLSREPWIAEQPSVLQDEHWVPWVSVAPVTAGAYGLTEHDTVTVASHRGRYRARLHVSEGVPRDTVCAPLGLRHPDGEAANPLDLLDLSRDPLTGASSWITTFVRLEAV